MREEGQVSTEYVFLIAFIMVLILPGAYLFYTSIVNSHDAQDAQIQKFAQALISKADDVYSMGPGAKAVVTAQLPSGISSVETRPDSMTGEHEIVVITSDLDYYFKCPAFLKATLPFEEKGQGVFSIALEAMQDASGEVYVLAGFAET